MASTTSRRGWASGRPPAAWVQAGGGSSASSSVHSGSVVSEGWRRLRWLGWGDVGVAVTGHTGGGAPGRLVGLVAQVATRSPVCGANRQAPRRHRNRATLRQGRPAHRFRNRHLDRPEDGADERAEPAFFSDLNLDQVVESITASRADYDLKPFFYTPLPDVDAVGYRHAVLRDLEKDAVFEAVRAFAQQMRSMREHLAQADKLHYRYQKERWFLDAVGIYCQAVGALADELAVLDLESSGLVGFRDHVAGYTRSEAFTGLASQAQALDDALATVRYSIHIKGNRVRVDRYQDQADYSQEVERTFAKFQQGAVRDYRAKLPDWLDMNHVEAQVLDLVAQLHPGVFGTLDDFCARHREYLDPTVGAFDREVQFYVAYLEYIERFKPAGLTFCYPRVSGESKETHALGAFDIALANKLIGQSASVVCNDFSLKGPERVLVVTGPNQGGKTTFARMFGQLHYLASLGCPVPGLQAALFLPDRIFTNFEREEDLATLSGKLEDELLQHRRHERELHLHDPARRPGARQGGHEPPHRPGPARRVRDVRRRAGVPGRAHRQHGQHGGPGQSGDADLQDRPAA